MDPSAEIREFLMASRSRVAPEDVGLSSSARRRVAGLRREEVAALAGVSVEYYVQIERGRLAGVSDEVLGAIARALRMDEAETAHLFDLFRALRTREPARPARSRTVAVPESVRLLADAMASVPVVLHDRRLDVVGANALGRALFAPIFDGPDPNLARFVFLDARASDFYADWDDMADTAAALLRAGAGRSPQDRALSNLVGELSTRSQHFAIRWAAHRVVSHTRSVKRLHHPLVGDLALHYEGLDVPGREELVLGAYIAEPASPSDDALRLLASWTTPGGDVRGETPAASEGGAQSLL